MRKDKIVAFVGKPVGRGNNRYCNAFSFSSNANQNDVEAFMCSVHIAPTKYSLIMQSNLERVRPYKGSPNQRTIFYYRFLKYGRVFINSTPVSLLWENRKEGGETIKSRFFKVR